MNSNLSILIQIAVGVIVFLSASLYYVTKWSEMELEAVRANRSQNEVAMNLHYLKNVSKEELDLLLQEKISNIKDLQNEIKTENDLSEFSEKLGVRKKLVEEWVTLGEFSSLFGMNEDYIKLLNKVGIMSLEDLRSESPSALLKKLSENNNDAVSMPSLGLIKFWVRNSNKILPELNT